MSITMKRRALLAAPLAGLARPALAQSRSPLVVMAMGGVFEKIMREAVIPHFEAEHPYSVTFVVSDDSITIPKMIASRGRAPYDVITLNDDAATLLRARGLLAPDQSSRLPNLVDIYDSMKPPQTAIYGTTLYEYDLVYRKAAFAEPPTSWQDLWRPGLTVGVPTVAQSYGMTFLYQAALLNGGSATDLDPGFAAIKRLEKIKIYKNVGQGLTLFQQGEIDAALYYAHRGQQLIEMGFPIARARPKEGVYAQRTGTQIPKGTGNMEGAVAWVNESLSPFYQTAFMAELYSPSNRRVMVPPTVAPSIIAGDAEVAALRDPPWDALLPQRDAVLDRWSREMG